MRERLGILISGNGSTMEAIVTACRTGELPIDVACVISSKERAGGVERAKRLRIPETDILVMNPRTYETAEEFGEALLSSLEEREVTLITQNGWRHKTPKAVVAGYRTKIFNQHPGPVPEFGGTGMYGMRVHATRLEFVHRTDREYWTEAIAHRVTEDYDEGAVVVSEKVVILPDDRVETLAARVLPVEHRVQLRLLQSVVDGSLKDQPERASLIFPGEEALFQEIKDRAIRVYPHG